MLRNEFFIFKHLVSQCNNQVYNTLPGLNEPLHFHSTIITDISTFSASGEENKLKDFQQLLFIQSVARRGWWILTVILSAAWIFIKDCDVQRWDENWYVDNDYSNAWYFCLCWELTNWSNCMLLWIKCLLDGWISMCNSLIPDQETKTKKRNFIKDHRTFLTILQQLNTKCKYPLPEEQAFLYGEII